MRTWRSTATYASVAKTATLTVTKGVAGLSIFGRIASMCRHARSYNIFRWYRNAWGRYPQADPIGKDGGIDIVPGTDAQKSRPGAHLMCLNDILGTTAMTSGSLPFLFSSTYRVRVYDTANSNDSIEKFYSVNINCFLSNGIACTGQATQW